MRKAPVDLKPGDIIVGQSRCLVRVIECVRPDGDAPIGARFVRTQFVSPFTVAEEFVLDGTALLDVWESNTGGES